MKPKDIKTYYKQNLPHIQPIGAAFFVTFRLKDSIPASKIYELKLRFDKAIEEIELSDAEDKNNLISEKKEQFFFEYDALLDNVRTGPHFLKQSEIANLVKEELHRHDGQLYDLLAYCIMSNHVHILIDTDQQIPNDVYAQTFETFNFVPLQDIMKRIKGPTAVYANRLLGREGKFWQRESYDHYIRNRRELLRIISYILENPVKAKIVSRWYDFPFSYWKDYRE